MAAAAPEPAGLLLPLPLLLLPTLVRAVELLPLAWVSVVREQKMDSMCSNFWHSRSFSAMTLRYPCSAALHCFRSKEISLLIFTF